MVCGFVAMTDIVRQIGIVCNISLPLNISKRPPGILRGATHLEAGAVVEAGAGVSIEVSTCQRVEISREGKTGWNATKGFVSAIELTKQSTGLLVGEQAAEVVGMTSDE